MAAQSVEDRLATVPLFETLSKKHLRALARLVTPVDLAAGRELMREGATEREFFVVISGEAQILRGGEVIAVRGPGDFFGEIALLLDRPRTASVIASTDMSVEVIERQDFKGFLSEHPELYEPLLAAAAERVAQLEDGPA
ncbi:MAG: cyclic nucleotide-binding domain-containing protein [Acidimicrobiia bacterium]|nr:cyclic nucleotide-binding domain-containing protein [Acidimicrobiia bacterium]